MRRRPGWLAALAGVLITTWVACNGAPTGPGAPRSAVGQLIADLEAAGASVTVVGPAAGPVLPAANTALRMNGERVEAYEFDSAEAAARAAAGIAADGSSIRLDGTAHQIEWVAPPHFFRRDAVIVLYVGATQSILEVLVQVLGPQVAGA